MRVNGLRFRSLVAGIGLALGTTGTATAQAVRLGVGAGLTVPAGDYGTRDNTGWHVFGGAVFPVPATSLRVRLEGMYGQTPHQGFGTTGYTKIGGGGGSVIWLLPRERPELRPYLVTGVGYYNVNYTQLATSRSNSALAWSAGAGAALFGVGPAFGFIEGRFMTIRTPGGATNLVPITLGLLLGGS